MAMTCGKNASRHGCKSDVKVVVSEFSLFGFGLPSGMGPSPAMCSAPIACFDSLQESMRVCALLKLSNYLPLTCFISTYSTDK